MEGRFSETYCSQVAVYEPTWEHMRIVSSLYTDVCTNGSLPGNFICRNMAAPRIRLTVGIADEAVWRTLARDSDELQNPPQRCADCKSAATANADAAFQIISRYKKSSRP